MGTYCSIMLHTVFTEIYEPLRNNNKNKVYVQLKEALQHFTQVITLKQTHRNTVSL